MRTTKKILATVAVGAAIVAAAVWLGLSGNRAPVLQPAAVPVVENPPVASDTTSARVYTRRPQARIVATNDVTAQASVADTNPPASWEDQIEAIIGDDTEYAAKARKMLELFPSFPEAGQLELAVHISNLLQNEDYGKFGKYLANAKTPDSVQEVIMTDVLNRPSSIKLPLLLEVASNPSHARAGRAKELLVLYLEEDLGRDWGKWQKRVTEWLKENPD